MLQRIAGILPYPITPAVVPAWMGDEPFCLRAADRHALDQHAPFAATLKLIYARPILSCLPPTRCLILPRLDANQ